MLASWCLILYSMMILECRRRCCSVGRSRFWSMVVTLACLLGREPGPKKITYGYHLGGQRIVVFFDLLDISSKQFSMITTADW